MKKLPASLQQSIRSNLDCLAENPFANDADVKKLQGPSGYRLRVGNYRVIYELENRKLIIQVLEIAHRKDIY